MLFRSRLFRRRRRVNRTSSSRVAKKLLRLLVAAICLLLVRSRLSVRCTSTCAVKLTRSCDNGSAELLDTSWLSARTARFTNRWIGHKLKNAAIYTCLITRKIPVANFIFYSTLLCPDVLYDELYDELFEVPSLCLSHRCLKRFGISHYIYAEFVVRTFRPLSQIKISPRKPTKDGKIAVLVEPRAHPLLEYTVKQVMFTLGPEWSLQLILSSANEASVRQRLEISEGNSGENIVITSLHEFGLDDMGKYGNRVQSAFSAHERLYEAIQGEFILWFQADVILRSRPAQSWLNYAYIGAEWEGCEYPTCTSLLCDKVCGGGNSGLSLRRRSKMLLVATRGSLPAEIWGKQSNYSSRKERFHFADENAHFVSDQFLQFRESLV